jgi:Icc-related predicted phosphoesterase
LTAPPAAPPLVREPGLVLGPPVRIAAVGDLHMGLESRGLLRPAYQAVESFADLLLLAGDLTRHGSSEEARAVADEVADLSVPVVAVLGNHDHHGGRAEEVARVLKGAGVTVLEGTSTVVSVGPYRIGVAGTKGFGGGFAGRCGSEFGEEEMKSFIRYSRRLAGGLAEALSDIASCDLRIALTHFSPVADTLAGEPLEIYPFLGSYLLAEVIDGAETDLAIHGHAHAGSERGMTSGGVRVRNVAQPVIRRAFAVYELHPGVRQPA